MVKPFIRSSEVFKGGWSILRSFMTARNKLHTIAAVLSVAVGSWAIVAMLSLANGIFLKTASLANRMGLDTIEIVAFNLSMGQRSSLTLEDTAAVATEIPNVRSVSPSLGQRMQLRFGGAVLEAFVEGFVDLGSKSGRSPSGWRIERGSYISQQDDDESNSVAVIGATVREHLFPPEIDPLDEHIAIGTAVFRVKGVMKKSTGIIAGASSSAPLAEFEDNYNNRVFVPFKTGADLLFGTEHPQGMAVVVTNPEQISETANEIRDLLLRRGVRGLLFRHPGEKLAEAERTRNQLWLGLGFIAGIALMAGGLSIMNIMLMSVKEQTREIGIRLTVGASQRDIFRKYLTEALVITLAGGLLGVMISMACYPIAKVIGLPVVLSPWHVVSAITCVAIVGLLCGVIPARRAAALEPAFALTRD